MWGQAGGKLRGRGPGQGRLLGRQGRGIPEETRGTSPVVGASRDEGEERWTCQLVE